MASRKRGLHEKSYPSSDEDQSLLVRRRSFERSQRAQRRLLCFGEPPDARDIEALVGAIPPQGAQVFAALHIPDLDGPVIAATDQHAAIGTHLQSLHRALMGLMHPHALSLAQVPPADKAIAATTDEPRASRAPGQRIDHLARLVPAGEARRRLRIPDEEFPIAPASTATAQPRPIGAPCNAHNGPLMSCQPLEQPATLDVPHLEVTISGPTDQPCPIGAPCQPTHPGGSLTHAPL